VHVTKERAIRPLKPEGEPMCIGSSKSLISIDPKLSYHLISYHKLMEIPCILNKFITF